MLKRRNSIGINLKHEGNKLQKNPNAEQLYMEACAELQIALMEKELRKSKKLSQTELVKNGTIKQKSSRGLKEAQKIVNFSNLSGEERRLAELMEKYEDVYYQVMKHQLEEGIEQGIEIGRQQGVTLGEKRGMEKGVELGERKGQVMICFKMNLPMEEIQKHTGLSVEEIEAFRKEME